MTEKLIKAYDKKHPVTLSSTDTSKPNKVENKG